MIELKDFPDQNTLKAFQERFPQLDLPALESWLSILKTAAHLEQRLNRFLGDRGLQQNRFFTLLLLSRNPDGLTPSALAERLGVSKPTITGLLQRMERDGLARRAPSPVSRRESIIQLTKEGERLLAGTLPEHYRRVSLVMDQLTPGDHATLTAILQKIPSA